MLTADGAGFARSLRSALQSEGTRVFAGVDAGLASGTDGLKADLHRQTEAVLGSRVANTWRSRIYPNKGDARGPAGFVWSKAPKIIQFNSSERVITPHGQAFAIPVNPVIQRRGRPMTIFEVETRFNQNLIPRRLPDGNLGLFANLVAAQSGRGFRPPTKGRLAKGRRTQLVLMFVLVRSIRARKIIDVDAIAQKWGIKTAELIGRAIGGE
jgi:hypothetical protein